MKTPHRFFLITLTFLLPGITVALAADWEWLNPTPQGCHLQASWGIAPDDLYSVGNSGTILHWDGAAWEIMSSPTEYHLRGIWGAAPDLIFAVGDHGTILSGDGSTWTAMDRGVDEHLRGIWGSGQDDIFVVGGDDGGTDVVILHWDGSSWEEMPHLEVGIELHDVWGTGPGDVYAIGDHQTFLHWDGSTWSALPDYVGSEGLYALEGTSGSDIYAVGRRGSGGTVYHWDGSIWTRIWETWGGEVLYDLLVRGPADILVAGDSGVIARYNGSSWIREQTDELFMHSSLLASSDGTIRAFGFGGSIWQKQGSEWSPIHEGPGSHICGIHGWSSDGILVAGAPGTILSWDGTSWSSELPESYSHLWFKGIWSSGPDFALAVGESDLYWSDTRGTIARWDGSHWQITVLEEARSRLDAVWGTDPRNAWAVSADGWILHWDGSDWTRTEHEQGLHDVWGTGATDVYAVGRFGTILHWEGTGWEEMSSGTNAHLSGIDGSSANNIYVVGHDSAENSTILLRWDGLSWTPVDTGFNLQHVGFRDVCVRSPDEVCLVGRHSREDSGVIFRWDGARWGRQLLGDDLWEAWGTADLGLYIGGNLGTVIRDTSPLPPSPTPTPTPHIDLGVRVDIPVSMVHPGEEFWIRGWLDNPVEPLSDAPVFFVLDLHGDMYFWPHWSRYNPPEFTSISFEYMDVPLGSREIEVLPSFLWPEIDLGTWSGLYIYGAMLNPGFTEAIGSIAMVEWGFGP